MKLRFFCDHCVPTEIADGSRSPSTDVYVLRDYLPTDSPDQNVIEKAKSLESILVSLNGDFADIVAYPPHDYCGIIAIQLHDHPEAIPSLMRGLREFLAQHDDATYYRGKLFIIEPHRIRIRS